MPWSPDGTIVQSEATLIVPWNRKKTWLLLLLPPSGYSIWGTENWLHFWLFWGGGGWFSRKYISIGNVIYNCAFAPFQSFLCHHFLHNLLYPFNTLLKYWLDLLCMEFVLEIWCYIFFCVCWASYFLLSSLTVLYLLFIGVFLTVSLSRFICSEFIDWLSFSCLVVLIIYFLGQDKIPNSSLIVT